MKFMHKKFYKNNESNIIDNIEFYFFFQNWDDHHKYTQKYTF